VAVVVEDRVEGHGSAGGGLEMREVLEAAPGALCQFLRARQMLPAVRERLRFLLQETEFLQMVRREADQVALPCDRDLQRLADPPRRIGGKPRPVADVEPV